MFDFVAGDTGSSLSVSCVDRLSGLPLNLSSSTVTIRWASANTPQSRAMTVTDAANGKAAYKFLAGELEAPEMTFDVVVSDAAGKTITNLDAIIVTVRPRATAAV